MRPLMKSLNFCMPIIWPWPYPHLPPKQLYATILPITTTIVNLSQYTGTFTVHFKQFVIIPLIQNKPVITIHYITNVLCLIYFLLSEITERLVKSHQMDRLSSNSMYNPNQSAHTKHQSIETTLLFLYDLRIKATSHQQISCLCLLDLSAAFDIINHYILSCLSSCFGILDTALSLFKTNILSRSLSVHAPCFTSPPYPLSCGVPQGSVLGPILLGMYITPLSTIIWYRSLNHPLQYW